MWREMAGRILPRPTFEPGVDERALVEAENTLGLALPAELRSLLLETNGIVARSTRVVWALDDIVEQHLFFHGGGFDDVYLPFDGLLFFADDGGGDHYAFHLPNGLDDIFRWDHENDSRIWVEPGLERYFGSVFGGAGH